MRINSISKFSEYRFIKIKKTITYDTIATAKYDFFTKISQFIYRFAKQ